MKLSMSLFNILMLFSEVFGFVSMCKRVRPTTRLKYLCDEDWDAGEVSWDFDTTTQYTSGFIGKSKTAYSQKKYIAPLAPVSLKSVISTPLYKTMQDDQITMASTSVIVKRSYKEFINLDTVVYHIYNIINSRLLVFTITEIAVFTFLTGIVLIYNKTNIEEEKRINKLYKFDTMSPYSEKYEKMRKLISAMFIVFTILLTKNVQDAE
jgi:hypothetical protein